MNVFINLKNIYHNFINVHFSQDVLFYQGLDDISVIF